MYVCVRACVHNSCLGILYECMRGAHNPCLEVLYECVRETHDPCTIDLVHDRNSLALL